MAFVYAPSGKLRTPPRFKHYCKQADGVVWHTPDGDSAVCEYCGRRVPSAELVVVYSVSDTRLGKQAWLQLPFRALPDAERIALANPEQPDERRDRDRDRALG